jgi:RNA polymerase sigma-70 factor (ECF subfamily)
MRERELLLLRAQTESSKRSTFCSNVGAETSIAGHCGFLPDRRTAEDAVQEAMLAAFTRLHQLQGRADFLTWASRIVINAALQHVHKTRTKPTVAWNQVDDEFDGVSLSEYVRDPQPTPEQRLQKLEQRERLEDALRKLPVEIRQAIQFCRFTDCSLKEASGALGLPVSPLKARIHRGRRARMVRVKGKAQVRFKPAAHKRSLQLCPATKKSLSPA